MLGQGCFNCDNLPLVGPAIEINDLCKVLGRDALVRNLSLQIGRGEIVGVIGRPGLRPHIMLDLLSGAVTPTSGSIVFHGEDVTNLRYECRFRRGIAQVLPINALVPQFTVLENVLLHGVSRVRPLFPRQGGKSDQEEALALLEFVGLAEHTKCQTEELDTHHKWLLTIAITLASDPSLLLLTDCGFGTNTPQETAELIRRVAAKGTSILLVSRSWHPVMEVCNRIEILREGEVIAASATKSSGVPSREIIGTEPMRHSVWFPDQTILKFRRALKRGWLPGRMQRRSERGYSQSSDH